MNININLDKPSVSIPSGRISNIFKDLKMKDIKFDESFFLNLYREKNLTKYLNKDLILNIAQKTIVSICASKRDEFHYNFNQLCIQTMLDKNTLKVEQFDKEFIKAKNEVLENKDILEKIQKLKKLRNFNG